jgi:hypothetical protein
VLLQDIGDDIDPAILPIISFAVKVQGLEGLMFGIIVMQERPDFENEKKRFFTQMSEDNHKLREIERSILELLGSKSGSELLSDYALVTTLEHSKSVS